MTAQKSSFSHYVGVDVGKFVIEIAFLHDEKTHTYDNDESGFKALWKDHKKSLADDALVALETTGRYENALLKFLVEKNVTCHRAPARQVKQFIRSYGVLAKTDASDAKILAKYAKERSEILLPYEVPDDAQNRLSVLHARYVDLVKMSVQEKNRLQAPDYDVVSASVEAILDVLDKQIEEVLRLIREIVTQNDVLKAKYDVLRTVDGVGEKTAYALLATMPELGKLDRKKAAALAGVAPHPNDSGMKKGYRHTRGGRPEVKESLHLAAMGAVRKKGSELQKFYLRLVNDSGKKKMIALTAVKRKILVIANARIAEIPPA